VGLGLALLPVLVLLAEAYPSYEERVRRAAGPQHILPLPSQEQLVEQVHEIAPATIDLQWQQVYHAEGELRTGIVQVYDLFQGEGPVYSLILFRHDIACDICRDLLAGVLYEWVTDTWLQIILLEPFERKGSLVDAQPFLDQFLSHSTQMRFALGESVDGITGATRSAKALIHRLHEAADWLVAHREEGKNVIQTDEETNL